MRAYVDPKCSANEMNERRQCPKCSKIKIEKQVPQGCETNSPVCQRAREAAAIWGAPEKK
jgi:hypothetical protein